MGSEKKGKNENRCESIRKTLSLESTSIDQLRDCLSDEIIENVIDELVNCTGKIVFSGCGTSGEACKKIVHTFSCVNCGAFFLSPSAGLHGGLGVLNKSDIVVLISKGGHTSEIDKMLPIIKAKGSKIIAVTENKDSYLAKNSTILLKTPKVHEAGEYSVLATSSTIVVIALFDAIAIEIGKMKGFSLEEFAIIHPEGAVGLTLASNNSTTVN